MGITLSVCTLAGVALRASSYNPDRLAGGRSPSSLEKGETCTHRRYEWRESYDEVRKRIQDEVAREDGEVAWGDRQPYGWYLRGCIVRLRDEGDGRVSLFVDVYPEDTPWDQVSRWIRSNQP